MQIVKLHTRPLQLTNGGKLTLFFTGVGSAFSKRHYQTNMLIIKGDDHLMIDCGTKTPQALFELGVPIFNIRNFLITHTHADHIGGLEEAMLLSRYVKREKPTIIISEIFEHLLWDMSLRGGSTCNEEHDGKNLTFGDMWKIQRPVWLPNYPRETLEANLGGINIKMMRTKHIPDSAASWMDSFWSCGMIIDDRILFTSDTRFDPDLVMDYDERFNLETIFHDCQFMPPGGVHASLEELKDLPPRIKKKTYLVHYGDNWEDNEVKVHKYGFAGLTKQWHFYKYG